MDAHKNFARSTVATAPSPATSGVTMAFATGDGANMPAVPFQGVLYPAGSRPTAANAEIVRITAMSGDSVTGMLRAQEGTTAKTVTVGFIFVAAITAKSLTDIETRTLQLSGGSMTGENDLNMGYGSLVAESGTVMVGATNLGAGVQMQGVQRQLGGLTINQRLTQSTKAGRTTAADCYYLLGDTTISSASANFTQADVGKYLDGPGAYIKTVTGSTTCTLDSPAKHTSDPFAVGSGNPATHLAITIIDTIPGSPLNIQINHSIDGTNNWATFGTQSPFGIYANAGPRGYINIEGQTEFHGGTNGGWAGSPILFQTSNVYKNRAGEALSHVGIAALFNVSTQFIADGAAVTLSPNSSGRMFVDNFMFASINTGAEIHAETVIYSSFSTELGFLGVDTFFGEYRQFWCDNAITVFDAKLASQSGFYTDTLIEATDNTMVKIFGDSVTIGATATSSTSVTIADTRLAFTVGSGLGFYGGQSATISSGANVMFGTVYSYNTGSGILTVDVAAHTGSGTFASWTIDASVRVTGLSGGNSTTTFTLNYNAAVAPQFTFWRPTVEWAFSGSALFASNVYDSQATYQNKSSAAGVQLGAITVFNAQNTYQSKTQTTTTAAAVNEFWSHPTYGVVSGGALAATNLTGFRASATINTGATLVTRYGFRVDDMTGTASSSATTTQYGLFIPALSGATTSWGVYNLAATTLGTLTVDTAGNIGGTHNVFTTDGVYNQPTGAFGDFGMKLVTNTVALGPTLTLAKARATGGVLAQGDVVGALMFRAASNAGGTTFVNVAEIRGAAEEATSTTHSGGRLELLTTPVLGGGSITLALAAIVDNAKSFHLAPTLDGTTQLVNGSGFAVKSDGSVWVAPSAYSAGGQPTAAAFTISAAGTVGGTHNLFTVDGTLNTVTGAFGGFGVKYVSDVVPAALSLNRARATGGFVAAGDFLGSLVFQGASNAGGTTFNAGAAIRAVAEQAGTATHFGSGLEFVTASLGGTSAAAIAARIDNAQSLHLSPTLTSGLVTGSTFAVKADGSIWIAPTAYTGNQPSAAAARITAAGGFLGTSVIATGLSAFGSGGQLTISTAGTISTSGNLATTGSGTLAVAGHATLEGVTSTGATGTGNFVFSASPTLTGTLTAAVLTATGLVTLGSAGQLTVSTGGNLATSGSVSSVALTATGLATFGASGQMTVSTTGNITTSGSISTTGTGVLVIAGATILSSTLGVSGVASFGSAAQLTISATGDVSTSGTITTTGTGGLVIAGAASLAGTVAMPGTVTFGNAGQMVVSTLGAISSAQAIQTSGALGTTGSGNLQIAGGTTLLGTMSVASTASFGSTAQLTISAAGVLASSAAITGLTVVASGLTGAVAATRYAGGVASVAPTTGTFLTGDWVVAQSGTIFVCTAGGSPGTWANLVGAGGPPSGAAGGSLTGTYPNPTIAAGVVTLAMQANAAANSFRGNNTGSGATPIDMTVAQAKTLLALGVADVTGAAPLSGPTFTGTTTIPVLALGAAATYTASVTDATNGSAYGFATTASMSHTFQSYTGTDTWTVAPSATSMFVGYSNAGTFKTASSVTLSPIWSFLASFTKTVDTATGINIGTDVDFRSAPGYTVANSGTFTAGNHIGFQSGAILNATGSTLGSHIGFQSNGITLLAGTLTTLTHVAIVNAAVVGGTSGTQIGIDIAALTSATTNIGIRNKASTLLGSTGQLVVDTSGNLSSSGSLLSSGTGGVGYSTGAGGTVTQATSRTTTVINNHPVGTITLVTATLAADTDVTFTLTNSTIAVGDILIFNVISGAAVKGGYSINAIAAAGSATVTVHNHTPTITASEAPVLAFAVIKGVTA